VTAGRNAEHDEVVRAAAFRMTLRRFLRELERLAVAEGLSPQRYTLLLLLKAAEPEAPSISELVERLQSTQPAVSELVTRAELDGLVRREPATDDRRVVRVRLTPEGERRFRRVFTALRDDRAELAAAAVLLNEAAAWAPEPVGAPDDG
jgi:DNA-binding MarR family transcriptional regulator